MVVVLTELYAKIVIFPFKSASGHPLINAIELPPFGIFDDSGDIDQTTLQLLVLLSRAYDHTREEFVTFPTMHPNMSRAVFNKHVKTDAQEIEHLRHEMAKLEREKQEMAAQLEREKQRMAVQLESAMAELDGLRMQLPHKKHKAL